MSKHVRLSRIRSFYVNATAWDFGLDDNPRRELVRQFNTDEFDRWLAEHNRQVRAEAWDEGYEDRRADEHEHRPGRKYANPYKEQP